ncbi:MAG: hypothetical protein IKC75_07350 [Clostridia bacterium]|nr:hypothetical protein [Clostridia bacterium]
MKKYDEYQQDYQTYLFAMDDYTVAMQEAKDEEKLALEAIRKEINEKELIPAKEKLQKEAADLLGEAYYPDLSAIIQFLESGRADSLKEALNLLADAKYKEQQLQIARRKAEEERIAREEAIERDRERAEEEERRRREDIAREERYRREEREREERRRNKEESERKSQAIAQCSMCASVGRCPNYAKFPNCPNFRHR